MIAEHEAFIRAIHERRKVRLHFYSKEDGRTLARVCAPMDYGPSRRGADRADRYHLWDYESDKKPHPISLSADQIVSVDLLDDTFEPSEFVTWDLVRSEPRRVCRRLPPVRGWEYEQAEAGAVLA